MARCLLVRVGNLQDLCRTRNWLSSFDRHEDSDQLKCCSIIETRVHAPRIIGSSVALRTSIATAVAITITTSSLSRPASWLSVTVTLGASRRSALWRRGLTTRNGRFNFNLFQTEGNLSGRSEKSRHKISHPFCPTCRDNDSAALVWLTRRVGR